MTIISDVFWLTLVVQLLGAYFASLQFKSRNISCWSVQRAGITTSANITRQHHPPTHTHTLDYCQSEDVVLPEIQVGHHLTKEILAVEVTLKNGAERAGGSEGRGRSIGEKGEGREGGRGKGGGEGVGRGGRGKGRAAGKRDRRRGRRGRGKGGEERGE